MHELLYNSKKIKIYIDPMDRVYWVFKHIQMDKHSDPVDQYSIKNDIRIYWLVGRSGSHPVPMGRLVKGHVFHIRRVIQYDSRHGSFGSSG